MRAPTLRSAPFWIAVSFDVILLLALTVVLLKQPNPSNDTGAHAAPIVSAVPIVQITPAKAEPGVSHQVTCGLRTTLLPRDGCG